MIINTSQLNRVALFSGGLDSLIGAIDALEMGSNVLLISHAGDGIASNAQKILFEALCNTYGKNRLSKWRVNLNFPESIICGAVENSTRSRSFLFSALGICASTGLQNVKELYVPENGFISLNVPLDLLRLGASSTRTTHPYYIARWNELLSLLDIKMIISNPYWNKTKGEMVSECKNAEILFDLII